MSGLEDALVFWNPWWAGEEIFEGFEHRQALTEIEPLVERKEVLVISGVRRCGKTTSMLLLIKGLIEEGNRENILYLNLDDPALSTVPLERIYSSYLELKNPKKKLHLFIDEIQNAQNWHAWVKKMYDSQRQIKIVASGSNSSLLKTDVSKLLTGRSLLFEMHPFSFREVLKRKGITAEERAHLLSKKAEIRNALNEYMSYGGFPEVVKEENDRMKTRLLKEYFTGILERDILGRFEVREKKRLILLAHYLLTNVSNSISAKGLQPVVHLNAKTMQEYFGYLEDVYLLFFVNHFSYSLKEQITYPRKVYCTDVGLRNAESFNFSRDFGRLAENLVYLKLREEDGEVYYWKDKRGKEIDFVVKKGMSVKRLIQVSMDLSDKKTFRREISALVSGMQFFKLKEALVVTDDYEAEQNIDGLTIRYIPLWLFLTIGITIE